MIPDASNLEDWNEQEKIIRRCRKMHALKTAAAASPFLLTLAFWIVSGFLPSNANDVPALTIGFIAIGIACGIGGIALSVWWSDAGNWKTKANEEIKRAKNYKLLLEKAIADNDPYEDRFRS